MSQRRTARERIMQYVDQRKTGATRKEIVRGTGLLYQTATPAVTALVRTGALIEVGKHRKQAAVLTVGSL